MRGVSAGDIKEAVLCRLLAKQARKDADAADSSQKRRALLVIASDYEGIADTLDAPPS